MSAVSRDRAAMLPFADLLDAAPIDALGSLPLEATWATLADCSHCDDLPSRGDALKVFADVRATLVLVPVKAITEAMMGIRELADDHGSFEAYHRWYVSAGDMPNHGRSNRWPCIASSDPDELIWDGWHRMHAYIAAGDDTVPLLRYDATAWWAAHERWRQELQPKPRALGPR